MTIRRDPFTEGVCRVLDIFYSDREPGTEPDWLAIQNAIYEGAGSQGLYSFPVDLLRVVHLVYEDEAAGLSRLFREKHGL